MITTIALGLAALTAAASPLTVYLNRSGGTYTPGSDDSSANVSSLVSATVTVPAFGCGDTAWGALVTCVQGLFAPFDVTVRVEDPGASPHVEVVVGGSPTSVGLPGGVGAVAPTACAGVPKAVAFVFPDVLGCGSPRLLCEAAANQVGRALGLDDVVLCQDAMSTLSGCGDKTFRDEAASCGETVARDCACGGTTQSSFARLIAITGPRPAGAAPGSSGGGGCTSAGMSELGGLLAVGAWLAARRPRRARR